MEPTATYLGPVATYLDSAVEMAPLESSRRVLTFLKVEDGHLLWTNVFKHKSAFSQQFFVLEMNNSKWVRQFTILFFWCLAQALARNQSFVFSLA